MSLFTRCTIRAVWSQGSESCTFHTSQSRGEVVTWGVKKYLTNTDNSAKGRGESHSEKYDAVYLIRLRF